MSNDIVVLLQHFTPTYYGFRQLYSQKLCDEVFAFRLFNMSMLTPENLKYSVACLWSKYLELLLGNNNFQANIYKHVSGHEPAKAIGYIFATRQDLGCNVQNVSLFNDLNNSYYTTLNNTHTNENEALSSLFDVDTAQLICINNGKLLSPLSTSVDNCVCVCSAAINLCVTPLLFLPTILCINYILDTIGMRLSNLLTNLWR